MTERHEKSKPGLWERVLERRHDRRQRRAWRRERRKGFVSAEAVSIQRQQHLHGQSQHGDAHSTSDGGSAGGT